MELQVWEPKAHRAYSTDLTGEWMPVRRGNDASVRKMQERLTAKNPAVLMRTQDTGFHGSTYIYVGAKKIGYASGYGAARLTETMIDDLKAAAPADARYTVGTVRGMDEQGDLIIDWQPGAYVWHESAVFTSRGASEYRKWVVRDTVEGTDEFFIGVQPTTRETLVIMYQREVERAVIEKTFLITADQREVKWKLHARSWDNAISRPDTSGLREYLHGVVHDFELILAATQRDDLKPQIASALEALRMAEDEL